MIFILISKQKLSSLEILDKIARFKRTNMLLGTSNLQISSEI